MNKSVAGRIGAMRLHALHDGEATTRKARATSNSKLDQRLLAEIDAARPNLSEQARQEALARLRTAHFTALGSRSGQARRARRIAS